MQRTTCDFHINWKEALRSFKKTLGILAHFRHFRHLCVPIAIIVLFANFHQIGGYAHAAQWTFIPRFSVQGEYTDNLFLTPTNEEEDIITTLLAGFTAGVSGRKGNLSFTFDPTYAFYKNNDDRNVWRLPASLFGRWDMTKKTLLDFSYRYLRTEDPLPDRQQDPLQSEDPPAQVDTTDRRGRQPYNRHTARVELGHRFGERDRIYVNYRYTLLDNEDNVFFEDSEGHNVNAGLTYYFTFRWGLDLNGGYTNGKFDPNESFIGEPTSDFDRWNGYFKLTYRFSKTLGGYLAYKHIYQNFVDETDFDYHTYTPTIGIDYSVKEDISLSTSVGYSVRVFDNEAVQEVQETLDRGSGLTFNADLIKTMQRGSLRFNVGAGFDQTYFTNQNQGFTRYYLSGLSANYQFYRRFGGNIFGFYRRSEFEDTIPQRNDNIYRAGFGLAYAPLKWMSIRLGYSYRQVQSNFDINDYQENRATLNILIIPEQPYRL